MVNVVVTGAAGRMGGQIIRLMRDAEGLAAGAARSSGPGWAGPATPAGGRAPGARRPGRGRPRRGARGRADVIVDFTSHEASRATPRAARRPGWPS